MSKFNKQVSDFSLSGRVVQILLKGKNPQILQLITTSGLYRIKLSKRLNYDAKHLLYEGVEVRVFGEKILNLKNFKVKLKATRIILASEPSVRPVKSPSSPTKSQPKPAKILICQKSDCRKRGGQAVCQVLEQALCDRGLHDQVKIEKTGCLKKCKLGPNLVFMPDKAHYTRVKPSDISEVIEKHLASTTT
ncbi:(2Fe-2S) ferredoxin domain-containing protein [Arthrospira platensis]|jgi:(2Fe-2S) ferredoxin|uniref:(2Fe-2S) ferredoxin domain-containing protein n=1 Tax=Limnospira platensis NIES-46 TaxID=1236695 RepID=A0A5M3TDH8_LIMPL|nr:(2Fe-2S) ferredoxin domain-containing protein [Arthrospira platensis]AMW29099.1 nucleotide-binding protein [Arthrospira platensis YZ]KDR55073.1 nucleotide-binding protein [Arthrospira platensis str. Paraca]MBD2672047.1 (2Fe-2S) ferredoxin domain-containing protein [Arthrospira platensis FACHB-439]MBD2713074.1 (2Fe-2S) ferredoxin domain-containing protein [Arthrospira platensis FACHB-835]MDF2212927.1 (2Fe-2S) ferredoxin domain-containing protein [Arthrospira platensis NCB002]MDT9185755.1 (2